MFEKPYDKFSKEFIKCGTKTVNRLSFSEYIKTVSGSYPLTAISDDLQKDLIVTSKYLTNCQTRQQFVNLLQNINYQRKEEPWTEEVVIAFMSEVISLYTGCHCDEQYTKLKEVQIYYRYNVPINRLKSQVSLFITLLNKGYDKYNISNYFSRFEILNWKYRKIEKLQKDVEANKITEEDLEIIKSYRGE